MKDIKKNISVETNTELLQYGGKKSIKLKSYLIALVDIYDKYICTCISKESNSML